MVTRYVLKVLKLYSLTACAILRSFKTSSLVSINHENGLVPFIRFPVQISLIKTIDKGISNACINFVMCCDGSL